MAVLRALGKVPYILFLIIYSISQIHIVRYSDVAASINNTVDLWKHLHAVAHPVLSLASLFVSEFWYVSERPFRDADM